MNNLIFAFPFIVLILGITLPIAIEHVNSLCSSSDSFNTDVDTVSYVGLEQFGTSIIGEKIESNSILNGLIITKMSFYFNRLQDDLESPAFSRVGVWDSDGVLVQDFGQINLITMTNGFHEFEFEDGYELTDGQYIGVRLPTNAMQHVAIAVTNTQTFNTQHTIFSQHFQNFTGQYWEDDTTKDIYFKVTDIDNNVYQNSATGDTETSCNPNVQYNMNLFLLIMLAVIILILLMMLKKLMQK